MNSAALSVVSFLKLARGVHVERDPSCLPLQPPGYKALWHCGVRVSSTGKLVAFISGIPATVRVNATSLKTVEINFLCVHKKLRHKRLAPVLIKASTATVPCL